MANIISALHELDTLVGGRQRSGHEKLLRTQELLGPLPAAFQDFFPRELRGTVVEVGTEDSLLDKILETRATMLEGEDEDKILGDDFSQQDFGRLPSC